MKFLNNLFAFNDDQQTVKANLQTSATLTSTLYSVIFVPKLKPTLKRHVVKFDNLQARQQVSIANDTSSHNKPDSTRLVERRRLSAQQPSTIPLKEDDSWVLIDSIDLQEEEEDTNSCCIDIRSGTSKTNNSNKSKHLNPTSTTTKLKIMALNKSEIELIKASWTPCKKDPTDAGVLLFKGLFTKFPQYLKFFPQFVDLDLENLKENKRLLKHAVKVIETVGFVVDSIGNESMTDKLNEALANLVNSHLNRNIGLQEFRNLGIVLLDFICDINNRRSSNKLECQIDKSSTGDSINQSSNEDSETMTSTLDKIRASSSLSSSSEEESYINSGRNSASIINENFKNSIESGGNLSNNNEDEQEEEPEITKIDTNMLIAAWTKLYGGILDLVKREEDKSPTIQ